LQIFFCWKKSAPRSDDTFGKLAAYKINIQKSVDFLYTNNKQTKNEIKKTVPISISSKQIKYLGGQVPMAHTCNLNYSGCRDQENQGSKPAQVSSSQDPISKKPFTEKGWWNGSRSRP
jgi:hypothetical protein